MATTSTTRVIAAAGGGAGGVLLHHHHQTAASSLLLRNPFTSSLKPRSLHLTFHKRPSTIKTSNNNRFIFTCKSLYKPDAQVKEEGQPESLDYRVLDNSGKKIFEKDTMQSMISTNHEDSSRGIRICENSRKGTETLTWVSALSCGTMSWLSSAQIAESSEMMKFDPVFEISELFELGIQLSYLLLLLGLLGVGSFFVIRQVLVRRELDLSAKELQEQVRSGDASATECFELGAVMLRRKFYPAANKYLRQAIDKWDGDDQDLAQVYNALGVSYIRDGNLDKGITQLETAVRLQPGYVTAWNNLGDAYEKKKDLKSALKAFEEVLLFDPNNKLAQPRRDALKDRVKMYQGIPAKKEK